MTMLYLQRGNHLERLSEYLEHLKICSNVLQNIQFMKPSRFHVVPAVKYNKYSYINNIYMWKLLRLSQIKLFVRRLHRNINRGKSEMGINSKNFIDTRSVRLCEIVQQFFKTTDTVWYKLDTKWYTLRQSDTLYDKLDTFYDKLDTIYDNLRQTWYNLRQKWYKWDKWDKVIQVRQTWCKLDTIYDKPWYICHDWMHSW